MCSLKEYHVACICCDRPHDLGRNYHFFYLKTAAACCNFKSLIFTEKEAEPLLDGITCVNDQPDEDNRTENFLLPPT